MEPVIYQITEEQLKNLALMAAREALKLARIKPGEDIWMAISEAYKLKGRRKIDNALKNGKIEFTKTDFKVKQSPKYLKVSDVNKL